MQYGVWLPIEQAPKDRTLLVCCWAGIEHWTVLVWKHNLRLSGPYAAAAKAEGMTADYFGDPDESDDYSLAKEGAGPTHFLMVPPIPSK